MDTLKISKLKVSTQIGIHEWEQRIKQTLLVDIQIQGDFSKCNDDIAKAVDYDALCQAVTKFIESRSFRLIETVAHSTADFICEEFKVKGLILAVNKPNAVANAEAIQIITERV